MKQGHKILMKEPSTKPGVAEIALSLKEDIESVVHKQLLDYDKDHYATQKYKYRREVQLKKKLGMNVSKIRPVDDPAIVEKPQFTMFELVKFGEQRWKNRDHKFQWLKIRVGEGARDYIHVQLEVKLGKTKPETKVCKVILGRREVDQFQEFRERKGSVPAPKVRRGAITRP